MGIKLIKKDNFFYGTHQEFMIDSEDDLEDIEELFDCEIGDKAYTPNGKIFGRHSDDFEGELWEKINSSNDKSDEDDSSKSDILIATIEDPPFLNKTWKEIAEAPLTIIKAGDILSDNHVGTYLVTEVDGRNGNIIHAVAPTPIGAYTTSVTFYANSPDDYPYFE